MKIKGERDSGKETVRETERLVLEQLEEVGCPYHALPRSV